jgi:hypothetical protein
MYEIPDSNGSAYTREERRNGPPLDYVGEKLRKAVESAHATYKAVVGFVPRDLPPEPEFDPSAPSSAKFDILAHNAYYALSYSLTAFLALYNMLGVVRDDYVEGIAAKSRDELRIWLDLIEREGSVHGILP